MKWFNLDALDSALLHRSPFYYVIVPGFIRAECFRELEDAFPLIRERGNFGPTDIEYGPKFTHLVQEISSPQFSQAFARKFDTELGGSRLKITLRGHVDHSDSGLHPDTPNKIVTALVYLNSVWDHAGGRLRLTRSGTDFDDFVEEVEPVGGNLVAFLRADNSYHGFLPYSGPRRSLQVNWARRRDEPVQRNRFQSPLLSFLDRLRVGK